MGQNSSAHVACVVGLQTDAVVVTETRLNDTDEVVPDNVLRKVINESLEFLKLDTLYPTIPRPFDSETLFSKEFESLYTTVVSIEASGYHMPCLFSVYQKIHFFLQGTENNCFSQGGLRKVRPSRLRGRPEAAGGRVNRGRYEGLKRPLFFLRVEEGQRRQLRNSRQRPLVHAKVSSLYLFGLFSQFLNTFKALESIR